MNTIVQNLFKIFKKNKINFFTGVPDSVLKPLSLYLSNINKKKHIITANEGGAVSLATGYNLATNKIALVYLQNSGLGNIINPITSMIHKEIYKIPMLLFIGWRGAPGQPDEVQHNVQGKITLNQLKLLNIPYKIFNKKNYKKQLLDLIKLCKKLSKPVAFILKKKDLEDEKSKKIQHKIVEPNGILRSDFISELLKKSKNSRIIATTGFTSRELFQIRKKLKPVNSRDFYMVGAMGHTSMVALGYSLQTKKKVICLDGDGSFLMHLGSSVISANYSNKNFKYILLNNNCHESVGGQPTSMSKVDVNKFVKSIGYKNYFFLNNKKNIKNTIKFFLRSNKTSFLNVEIQKGALKNLARINNLLNVKKDFAK